MSVAIQSVDELLRLDAPALRPQAIAFDGTLLWLGSIETERLYAVAPNDWTVREESAVPGKPWGATAAGDQLFVILGQTEEDHRTIFRYVPGHGLRTSRARSGLSATSASKRSRSAFAASMALASRASSNSAVA